MKSVAQRASGARSMGNFVPLSGRVRVEAEPRKVKTLVVTTERCSDCQWPQVCEGDTTCWDMERRLHRELVKGERAGASTPPARADVDRETRRTPGINARRVGEPENTREEPSMATYDCKIEGCEERAKANRGRFAYLCDTHKAEALQAAPPPAKRPKAARNGTVTKTRMELLRDLIAKQQDIDELESQLQDQHAQFEAIAERFAKARS